MQILIFLAVSLATLAYASPKPWVLASITQKKSRKSNGSVPKRASSKRASGGEKTVIMGKETSRFLAKLLPAKDDSYLIAFHTDDNDHAAQMEPVVKRLEEDLQTKVRRVNVSRRREFYTLMEVMGHDECGQLPFYYNRKTAQAVCGATSYLNLKRWGTGDLKHLFQDPPENMFEQEVDNSRKRKVGFSGFFQEKLVGADMAGEEKADRRSRSGGKKESTEVPEEVEKDSRDATREQPKGKMAAKQRIEARRASRAQGGTKRRQRSASKQ
jgi:hypothetical protein